MYRVLKRDGITVDFEISKISAAIIKAFEALNNIQPQDRIIIILNDNGMSISRSVGTLKGAFSRMRTRGYYRFKGNVRNALLKLPARSTANTVQIR